MDGHDGAGLNHNAILRQSSETASGGHDGAGSLPVRTAVIIPNYNGLRFLPDCMKALEGQEAPEGLDGWGFYIVVVDNASEDGSLAWLRQWRAGDPGRRVVLRNRKNLGFSEAVNRGIHWAMEKGLRYALLLNNDTRAHGGFVRALEEAMERDEKGRVFAASSRMVSMRDPSRMDDAGDQFTIMGWQFQRGQGEPASEWDRPGRVFSACAGAAIYRLSALSVTGLFDVRHFAYLEDVDISFRANLYGYHILYVPGAVCEHAGSGTTGSKYNRFKVRLSARNSVYLLYKNMPLPLLLLNFPSLLSGFLVKAAFFVWKGYGADYLLGLLMGLFHVDTLKKADFARVPPARLALIELRLMMATWEYLVRQAKKFFSPVRQEC